MDLSLLDVFRAIAEEGSFSRAGQRMLRTQPAISLALKRLETELGATLIDRNSKSLALTDAGRLVLDAADRFEQVEHQLRAALAELRSLEAGRLTVGANESTALYLIEHVVAFRRAHPGVAVELRRSLSSAIPEDLIRGRLEMGAISYDPGDERLVVRDLYEDSLAFVVSPEHRFAERNELSIQELGGEVFIAHNVSGPYRRRVIETFQRHHVPLNMPIELPTIETIRTLVEMNMGVAFLPGMCVRRQIEQGTLREVAVREVRMERKIRLVYPAKRRLSHAAEAFLEVAGLGGP